MPETFDPAKKHANCTLADSNMSVTNQQVNWGACTWAYLLTAYTTGKKYFEFKIVNISGTGANASIGIGPGTYLVGNIMTAGMTFHSNTGIYLNGTLQTTLGGGWANNNIVQMAVDYDAGKVWFGLNNSWSGSPSAGTGGTAYAASGKFGGSGVFTKDDTITRKNTAQLTPASQTYTPPTGFTAADAATAHSLSINDFSTASPDNANPALGGKHVLTIATVSTASPTLGPATFGQKHAFSIAAFNTGSPNLGPAVFGQKHATNIANVAVGSPNIGTPSLGTIGTANLTINGVEISSPTIGTNTLVQRHAFVVPSFSTQSPTSGPVIVQHRYNLSIPAFSVGQPAIATPSVAEYELGGVLKFKNVLAAEPEYRTLWLDEQRHQSADVEMRVLADEKDIPE